MNQILQDKVLQQKVDALLSSMTLDEKIGQMTQADRMTCSPHQVKQFHIGSILSSAGSCPEDNTPAGWVAMNDAYWQASIYQDSQHIGIPLLYGLDAIHGNNNVEGATIFPHNIGLGAADDPELIERIAKITTKEVLASGVDWAFAPTLAVARDYRWGRTYESYSELPDITCRYATKIIQGLQGKVGHQEHLLACAKHWIGDGGTLHGVDQGDTIISWEQLKAIHIPPYEAAIQAGVLSIMVSFSSWNGEKCHSNKFLLIDTLKHSMGFEGFVISDMQGIDYLADDFYLAVGQGVNAGIDMFMVPRNWQLFIEHLRSHIELGTVCISRIDDAVRRILSVKFALGAFDKPKPSQRKWANHPCFGCDEHRQVAREAVQKSLVLLKNDHQLLPLSKKAKILVAGKNSHNLGHQCGGFTITWQGVSGNEEIVGGTSIWQGIQQIAPNACLSADCSGKDADPTQHDVVIVVVGEAPYAEGMGDIRDDDKVIAEAGAFINGQVKVLQAGGNSLELSKLYPEDIATIKTIAAKGIPIVTVLVSGRPLLIEQELATSDAFVAAWLPGSEGQGVADVLFGDHDFSGKLSFSWPQSSQPVVNWGDDNYSPLFPYGFGLNYSISRSEKAG